MAVVGFNFQVTLPMLAKTVFDTGAMSFGLLTAAMAVGSLLAALATTVRRRRPRERTVVVAALFFAALEICSGLVPAFPQAFVLIGATGFAVICFAQAANHRVQLSTEPAYRGRVMALHTLICQGTTPFGALLTGRLTAHAGARSGLWAAGLVCLVAAPAVSVGMRRRVTEGGRGRSGAPAGARGRPPHRSDRCRLYACTRRKPTPLTAVIHSVEPSFRRKLLTWVSMVRLRLISVSCQIR